MEIHAYHGTQRIFETFSATASQQSLFYHRPGKTSEEIDSLARAPGVWITEDSAVADQYATGREGRVLDVTLTLTSTADIVDVEDSWDDRAVSSLLAAGPKALRLVDRYASEILVLDVSCLTITGGTRNCGCDISDDECGCWDAQYE